MGVRYRGWILILVLVHFTYVHGQCSVNSFERIDCGQQSQTTCENKGCCWSPLAESDTTGAPWCFYPSGKEPEEIKGPYVHLFEWSWKDIALECENWLGPKGFTAIQVSPPQEHRIVNTECNGRPWYERYQVVSYKLISRSGNREEFIDMVNRCKNVGVDIWVDAVINHTTGRLAQGTTEIGIGGTEFGYYVFENYTWEDFNHRKDSLMEPNCGIRGEDYNGDVTRVRDCDLLNLSDLNLSSPRVQNVVANYMQDLLDIGVRGFRIDASKHMFPEQMEAIFAKLTPSFIFHEVIDMRSETISYTEYTHLGSITEFWYGSKLSSTFKSGTLSSLHNFGESWGLMDRKIAMSFIDNHDNQRSHASDLLTYRDGKVYELANVFMLGWPYGYAQVMSSYLIKSFENGPPPYPIWKNGRNTCFDDGSEWICEHRWRYIANMARFRAQTKSSPVIYWWSNQNDQIAFSRGTKGFVAINAESSSLTRVFKTSLPEGLYCNILLFGEGDNSNCQNYTVTAQGEVSITIPPMDAVAFLKEDL